jgi:hypothetical protein
MGEGRPHASIQKETPSITWRRRTPKEKRGFKFMMRELYVRESGGEEECVEHTPKWNVNG